MMCSASSGWQNHLRYWCVDQYAKTYGASGIYLDQVAAPEAKYCFDFYHNHEHHGAWGQGHTENLRRIVEAGRKVDPDFMMAIEGCGDAVGQYAHAHLISPASAHGWFKEGWFPEMFHYTFPEYILFDGYANGIFDGLTQDEVVSGAFVQGYRFDVRPGPFVQEAIALRKKIAAWVYWGRFMDDVGVEVSDDAVVAKLFVRDDETHRGGALCFWNQGGKSGVKVKVDTAGFGPVKEGLQVVFGGDARPAAYEMQAGTVEMEVPSAVLSSVLLINRVCVV